MVMITGGAFQGKTKFAVEQFGLRENDILDGGSCGLSELQNAKCITHYELAVKRLLENGTDPLRSTEELSCEIVMMNEIGCGIIPLERSERVWREMTGRCGCMLAQHAEHVIRLVCGIPIALKGALL